MLPSTLTRQCQVCARPLAPGASPLRVTCSDVCRQRRHRLRVQAELARLRADLDTYRRAVAARLP